MESMFKNYLLLESLNLSNFTTPEITNVKMLIYKIFPQKISMMKMMFKKMGKLNEINLLIK